MRVVGVTFVDDAVRLDFPVVPAVTSILPLCDEIVANVGPADDGTAETLAGIDPDRVRIVRGAWDRSQGRAMLAAETNRALAEARGDWAVYIQADEVLHESGVPLLAGAMGETLGDPRVEGLLVDFLHFYGNFDTVATSRSWYRREVRVVRLGCGVASYRDAQGFRVGPTRRRIRARRTGATMYHYGWARPPEALRVKRGVDQDTFYDGRDVRSPIVSRLPWEVGLRPFRGGHPRAAAQWVAARCGAVPTAVGPARWSLRMGWVAVAWLLERVTGWRPFAYRNYVEV